MPRAELSRAREAKEFLISEGFESYISSFKRQLTTLVGLTNPKDLEDMIKEAYHKFVKEEAPRRKAKASSQSSSSFSHSFRLSLARSGFLNSV